MTVLNNENRPKKAFSVKELAAETTLSRAFLRNEIRAGKLKVKRCGRRVLILRDDLMKYLHEEKSGEK